MLIMASFGFSAMAHLPPTINLTRTGTENRLFWWGETWTDYVVESSTNLISWQDDGIMSGDGNEKGAYTYVTQSTEKQKFYRVRFSRMVPHVNITVSQSSSVIPLVRISTSAQTPNVALAAYIIRANGAPGTLRSFPFTVTTVGANVADLFTNIRIKVGPLTYFADRIGLPGDAGTNATVIFNNLNIPLSADADVEVVIWATVAQDTGNVLDNATATTSINAWGTPANDTQYRHTPEIEGADFNPISVAETYQHTYTQTYSASGVFINNALAIGSPLINGGTGEVVAYSVSFSFNMTAVSQPIYVSTNSAQFLEWGVSPGSANDLMIGSVVASPGSITGDGIGYYYIPSGETRHFTFTGMLMKNGTVGTKTVWIPGVFYGTSVADIGSFETSYGLQDLRIFADF